MSWVAVGVAAVGAGASIYSASQTPDAPVPVQPNPGRDLIKYIQGLEIGMPDLYKIEQNYRPQFGDLNIADQQQYLQAMLGMSGDATTEAQKQIEAARNAEYGNMAGNTDQVLGILGGINPAARNLADRQTALANERYDAAGTLTAQEKRMSDQTAREAFAARGRLNDNASVAAEILGREDVLRAKRAEAANMGAQAYSTEQNFTSQALPMLTATPASQALGMDLLAGSQGIIGRNVPALINPDAGINLGQQNAANLNSYMQAQAAAQSNQNAVWGQLGSSLIGLAGTLA